MVNKNLLKIKKYIQPKDETNGTYSRIYGSFESKIYRHDDLRQFEEKYFVSIIIPTFNRKNTISRAIDSVLNQYFKNNELIIIDDGSGDGSEDFIKEKYTKSLKSNKIKYFKLDHHGVSAARNFGLSHASGNIIAYLDSDNEWNPKYLFSMLSMLDANEQHNCAYCDVKITNQNTHKDYILNQGFDRKKLLQASYIDLNGFIHKKHLFDERGGFDEDLSRLVDWDLIIKYTENNTPLHLHKTLVNCFISSKLNNIALSEPLKENMDKIHQKYWSELYAEEYEAIRDFFDQEYYLNKYEDVLKSNINPIYHYLTVGHKENRNPSEDFDTSFYKNRYPDVVKYNLNPLVHYAQWGIQEGRKTNDFKKRDSIINNNLMYLSNYEFENEPLVSIIILNKDGLAHLKNLFNDFSMKTNYSNFEIIVVDNGSKDDSVKYLKSLNELDIRIIENKENVSFAQGNNDAVKIANGEYVLLLNNDIEPTYGWLNEMMGTILFNENVGAVGAKLVYPFIENPEQQKYSYTIQHAGDIFRETINNGCLYEANNQNKFLENVFDSSISANRKCLLVTGAVLLTKKDIYLEVGGLDESFWYGYEDVDFNLKLYQKGYDVIFASAALLFHHESATPKKARYLNNHEVLCKRWSKFLFKKLLKDKMEQEYFFTDKPLHFLFVVNHNFMENRKIRDSIHSLTRYLNDKNYNTSLKLDISDLNIDSEVDILISFTADFDVENIFSRENLIKILFLNNGQNEEDDFENWDIVLCDDENFVNRVNSTYSSNKLVYQNLSDLNENIIPILYEFYLKE